jgi:hypothetical protein
VEYKIKFNIGDYSDDGHGRNEEWLINSNRPASELKEAYKASCRLMGVSFNHNDDFTGLRGNYEEVKQRQICAEYQDSSISEYALGKLVEHGYADEYVIEWKGFDGADHFLQTVLWFIGKSMPEDWKWEFVKDDGVQTFNGWGGLSCQLGYGLYGH